MYANKKNITIIQSFGMYGGVETVLFTILNILQKKYNCQILSTDIIPDKAREKLELLQIPFKIYSPNKNENYFLYRLKKWYARHQCFNFMSSSDIIIDFKNGCGRYFMNKIREREKSTKQILWIHGGSPFVKNLRCNFSNYDSIICLTDSLTLELKEKYPEIQDKFVRLYNPMDIASIRKLANLNISLITTDNFFVHVSRLEKDKDIKALIDAYNLFYTRTHSNTKLLLVGEGSTKQMWESYASQKSAQKQIIFCGQQQNPFVYMKKAKGVLLSSYSEGLPCTLIEALSCSDGVVVSSDCPNGPREILLDGNCGILFEPGNISELANIFEQIDNGKITRKNFEKFIPKSLERFAIQKIEKELYSILERQ